MSDLPPYYTPGSHIDIRAADGSLIIGWLASQTPEDVISEWFRVREVAERHVPAHQAIRDAENDAMRTLHVARRIRPDQHIEIQTEMDVRAVISTFRVFALTIQKHAPASIEKDRALTATRLAFFMAMEGMQVRQRSPRGVESLWQHLHGQAIDQLYQARWWACAAVDAG